jgi:hypothetical protein
MKTPLDAFLQWFDGTPLPIRKYLAHIFQVCTADDTRFMTAGKDQSLDSFRAWAAGIDFPLRIAARMFYVRSIFDMVILHHREIVSGKGFFHLSSETNNIIQISTRQWEGVLESWKALRQDQMSDIYIHSWASWMIKLQMETP